MSEKNLEILGGFADKIDNLLGALELQMPAQFHVDQMKRELKELSEEVKQLYEAESGENPWD